MAVALAVLLLASGPLPSTAAPVHPLMAPTLSASDNGKTITLSVGTQAELRLPDNPSTGYRWTFKGDTSLIGIEEGAYIQLSNSVGGGGERQWFLKAKNPGRTTVLFKRWREWEGEQSAIESYGITVHITPQSQSRE